MTPAQLQSHFAYMFQSDDEYAFSYMRGWFVDFVRLCEQIDAALGEDKRKFRFVQTKEKFGSARYYWSMKGHTPHNIDVLGGARFTTSPPKRNEIATRIAALVAAAEERTHLTCIACGQPGAIDRNHSYFLTLCAEHTAQRKADRDAVGKQIWLAMDEDMPIEESPEREAAIERVISDRERVIEAATQVASGDRGRAVQWYDSRVKDFQEATPAQLVAQGRIEDVLRHLSSLTAGSAG